MGDDETWLIVYAARDDSFSLIKETEAVFDKEHLELEDKITFMFDSEEWEGVVKGMGGNDDYESLKSRMDQLNSDRKKREDSFHDDRPRKTRAKFPLQVNVTGSRSTKPVRLNLVKTEVKTVESKKGSPLAQILDTVTSSSSGSVTSNSSGSDLEHSPPSSPNPECTSGDDKKKANAAKRKNKDQDITKLKKLKGGPKESNGKLEAHTKDPTKTGQSSGDVTDQSSISHQDAQDAGKPTKRESIKGTGSGLNVFEDSDEVDAEQKEDKNEKNKPKKKKKRGKGEKTKDGKEGENKEETGQKNNESKEKSNESAKKESVMRWKEGDENVVLVQGRSKELADKKFYISTSDLTSAKSKDNATTFAKSLLVAAFTDKALYTHSVSGGQYRAGGKANITQKPALPADVIAVIADVALHRQAVKKWNPPQTKKEITSQLRQKLVDLRPRLKKQLGIE